jgi:hypothetical protein
MQQPKPAVGRRTKEEDEGGAPLELAASKLRRLREREELPPQLEGEGGAADIAA